MQRGGEEEVDGVPGFAECPSFREEASAAPLPEYAAAVDDSDEDSDFEFAFVIQDPEIGPGIGADEIFSNGRIRTIYPVFDRTLLFAAADEDGYSDRQGSASAPAEEEEEGEEKTETMRGTLRRLLMEDRGENPGSSTSSSAADELDGISPGTYCVWTPNPSASPSPSPSRCRKSRSTGSSLRWRLRDLVVGRSHSDGKEKFVFLAADDKAKNKTKTKTKGNETPRHHDATPPAEKPKKEARARAAKATALDVLTAHQIYYGRAGPTAASAANRRSFLPYRQDLVGLFASVNGITRTHHPF